MKADQFIPRRCGRILDRVLTKLVLGKRIILKEPLSDHSDRVLALVYVDNKLINEILVRGGYAMYTRQAGKEKEAMKEANTDAREGKIGIFSSVCYQKDPPDEKCAIKGNVEEREKRKIFFRPDCPNYDQIIIEKFLGEDWFCSEKEAQKAGFTMSGTCR